MREGNLSSRLSQLSKEFEEKVQEAVDASKRDTSSNLTAVVDGIYEHGDAETIDQFAEVVRELASVFNNQYTPPKAKERASKKVLKHEPRRHNTSYERSKSYRGSAKYQKFAELVRKGFSYQQACDRLGLKGRGAAGIIGAYNRYKSSNVK